MRNLRTILFPLALAIASVIGGCEKKADPVQNGNAVAQGAQPAAAQPPAQAPAAAPASSIQPKLPGGAIVTTGDEISIAYILWGGDMPTFYGNGGLETRTGTTFAEYNLHAKLFAGDDTPSYWGANNTIKLNSALKTAVQAEAKGGAAAQADYDLLMGLPDDVAKDWLSNVTNMDLANWAIGEQKPEPPAAAAPGATQANPDLAEANQPASAKPEEKGGIPFPILMIGGILAFFLVVGFLKSLD